jgi:hypothetical protein
MLTKTALLAAYSELLARVFPWAREDPARLARFMASAERTLRTEAKTWNHDSPTIGVVWRSLGGKGKPTLKAMRALPE